MTLYIENASRRHWEINVRLPESRQSIRVPISSGRQEEIKNLTRAQEDAFIEHLCRYGAKSRAELSRNGNTGFEGLVYSTDKPFQEDHFHQGNEEVLDQAQSRAVVEANKAALASDLIARKIVPGVENSVSTTEVILEHEQAPKKGKKDISRIRIDRNVASSDSINLQ